MHPGVSAWVRRGSDRDIAGRHVQKNGYYCLERLGQRLALGWALAGGLTVRRIDQADAK
jgi:hypothetical protein